MALFMRSSDGVQHQAAAALASLARLSPVFIAMLRAIARASSGENWRQVRGGGAAGIKDGARFSRYHLQDEVKTQQSETSILKTRGAPGISIAIISRYRQRASC